MNKVLYHAVYGNNQTPTADAIKELAEDVLILPDGIKEALIMYYQLGKSAAEIAAATGNAQPLVERRLQSGISLLQVFTGVYGQ